MNNIFVSSVNHGWDAQEYLLSIPVELIKEIHLAGHSTSELSDKSTLLVDTHDNYVCVDVWLLYQKLIDTIKKQKLKMPYVLIEWDENIPPLEELLKEAQKAKNYAII